MKKKDTIAQQSIAEKVAIFADARKAQDIAIYNVQNVLGYCDYIVIATGTSDRHVQSIADHVEQEMSKLGLKAIGMEGIRQAQWVLVDFGSIVLHVFHPFTRDVYKLESLWEKAQKLTWSPPVAQTLSMATAVG